MHGFETKQSSFVWSVAYQTLCVQLQRCGPYTQFKKAISFIATHSALRTDYGNAGFQCSYSDKYMYMHVYHFVAHQVYEANIHVTKFLLHTVH